MPAGLRVDRRERVSVFVVDRPGVRNALDSATLEALTDAVAEASADPDIGAGPWAGQSCA